ncbi:MAG: pyroglutamyl-peptidase I, partial [Limnochordia bacterium]|nr:pyroglutamyl-peptidase I [Limnochordia bacterium]
MSRVLLTGFDAFGGESINPAWEVIKQVAEENVKGVTLSVRQLPTVFGEAIRDVAFAIEAEQPDLVLALGQAGGRPSISLERVALNMDDATIPDNRNNQPVDVPIVAGAPAAYFSTLPIRAIMEKLHQAGIPSSISNSA